MNKNRDIGYLKDIKESIELINSYLADVSKLEFFDNQEKQDAVVNRLMVMGEAAKLLSQDIRNKYSRVSWDDMAGMRDILIHRYHGIDIETVWETVKKDLPEVEEQIVGIIEELKERKEA